MGNQFHDNRFRCAIFECVLDFIGFFLLLGLLSHFGVVDPFVFLLNCLFVVLGFVVLLLLVREGVRSRSICCALRSSKSAETRRVGGLSHA